jgi:hypothetical protein
MTTLPELRSLLTSYNPRFAKADYGIVVRWQADGADMERDILPVIRNWTAKKDNIFSLRFFEPYVLKARDARLAAEKPAATADDRKRAAKVAFVTRVVGKCMPQESAWLEAWEQVHGRVTP